MAIFLVRHGETNHNARRIVQPPDAPLSERGHSQAARIGERLAAEGVALILASDLERAHATARAIERSTSAPLELDAVLQERNFGDVRGTPYDELGFDLFAPDYRPPRGEDWPTFELRVDRAWESVRERASSLDGNLAVVTHGLVCRSLATRHLVLGEDAAPEVWGNTSLTVIEASAPWAVRRLNCTRHLDAASRASDPAAPSGL